MFKEEFKAVCNAGNNKIGLLEKNMVGYLASALIAGLFITFGSMVTFTMGAGLNAAGSPMTKVLQSSVFSAALSLVVAAGAELFTGNNFVLGAASLNKTVPWGKTVKLWIVCYIGNLIGSLIGVGIFQLGGVPSGGDGAVGAYFATVAAGKMALSPLELITRAILCNILVCLAVWCSIKMKSESGKLIMVFWCIFVFMMTSCEHSVANMSILAIGLLNKGTAAVSMGGYFYNISIVTIGNMIGGIVGVALPYYLIAKENK